MLMGRFVFVTLLGVMGFIGGGIMVITQPLSLMKEWEYLTLYPDDRTSFITADKYLVAIKGTIRSIHAEEQYIIIDSADPYTAGGTRPLMVHFTNQTPIRHNRTPSVGGNALVISPDLLSVTLDDLPVGVAVLVWLYIYQGATDLQAGVIWYDNTQA